MGVVFGGSGILRGGGCFVVLVMDVSKMVSEELGFSFGVVFVFLFFYVSSFDLLKVFGLLILFVGFNCRRVGGGSRVRISEAVGG